MLSIHKVSKQLDEILTINSLALDVYGLKVQFYVLWQVSLALLL